MSLVILVPTLPFVALVAVLALRLVVEGAKLGVLKSMEKRLANINP
jgi:hypothetical protein